MDLHFAVDNGSFPATDRNARDDLSHNPPRGAKRRRIGLACLSCRKRKSKCNGQKPVCNTCHALGFTCQYVTPTQAQQTVVVGKEHLSALETRLSQLETMLASHAYGTPEASPQGSSGKIRSPVPESTSNIQEPLRKEASSQVEDDITVVLPSADGRNEVNFADEENRVFFGPSSGIAFATELSHTLKGLYPANAFSTSNSTTAIPNLRFPSSSDQGTWPNEKETTSKAGILAFDISSCLSEESMYYLPPEEETTELIDRYFRNTGLISPYIHQDSFRDTYRSLKDGKIQQVRKTWLGLLNMVLAMARTTTVCATESEVTQRQKDADAFYKRANCLCKGQMISGVSLEIVIYLLLVSKYIQGTASSIQTWATHGLAVKAALQIGLHSSSVSKKFPPHIREMRNRAWHGVVLLDRMLSMTFGRPAAIPESYCRLELPRYFEALDPGHPFAERRRICRYGTDSFRETISLYAIISKTLVLLYDSNLGCESDPLPPYELAAHIFRLRHSLDSWNSHLSPDTATIKLSDYDNIQEFDTRALVLRLRTILTLRYHNARLLAHRVVIQRACELIGHQSEVDRGDANAIMELASSSILICLDSSTQILDIITKLIYEGGVIRQMLPAWWYALYYAFDAALMLFATMLLVRRTDRLVLPAPHTCETLRRTFSSFLGCLDRLEDGNRVVYKCGDCLRQLFAFLESEVPVPTGPDCGPGSGVGDGSIGFGPGTPFFDPSLPFIDFGSLYKDTNMGGLYEFDGELGF